MASEMCDSELLVKISGGSAIEAKYHLPYQVLPPLLCLTACPGSHSSSTSARAKAQAFIEQVVHIENI